MIDFNFLSAARVVGSNVNSEHGILTSSRGVHFSWHFMSKRSGFATESATCADPPLGGETWCCDPSTDDPRGICSDAAVDGRSAWASAASPPRTDDPRGIRGVAAVDGRSAWHPRRRRRGRTIRVASAASPPWTDDPRGHLQRRRRGRTIRVGIRGVAAADGRSARHPRRRRLDLSTDDPRGIRGAVARQRDVRFPPGAATASARAKLPPSNTHRPLGTAISFRMAPRQKTRLSFASRGILVALEFTIPATCESTAGSGSPRQKTPAEDHASPGHRENGFPPRPRPSRPNRESRSSSSG